MILYRPVGLQELALIYDSDMKTFPARLPQRPIFYPVLQLEYARQTASDWNAKNGQFAGYVTQFKVEDEYIDKFEEHAVGGSQYQELWVPAEDIEEFNKHLTGPIKVLEGHFGDAFKGFIPEAFGLQGKDAVAQFTLLANSFIYKRMDFYLEIRRNHKAVFLNYPFWQKYEFKNQGLKGKVLQAIKEAWLTSFPKIPLPQPPPVREVTPLVKHTDPHPPASLDPVYEDITITEQTDASPREEPEREEIAPVNQADPQPLRNSIPAASTPAEQTELHVNSPAEPVEKAVPIVRQADSPPRLNRVPRDISPEEQPRARAHFLANPVREQNAPPRPTSAHAHFTQGIKLGLSGSYQEAIEELSRAVEADPNHVAAYTSLGVAFHRLGEDDRALDCYEAALKIAPKYAEAHYFRSNILYSQGNVREAMEGYTRAVGLKPQLLEAHEGAAPQDRLADYSGSPAGIHRIAKPAHHILELNKSLETNPGQADLYKERAAEYYRLWNYEQAIADYNSALRIQPDDAGAFHLRGVAYEQLGQHERAREDYKHAIAIDPQLPDLYLNRGVNFGRMGNFQQSIASLTDGIRLAPTNPDAYFNRGTTYFQQGDFERAIQDFSNVLRLSPNDEAAYYWRGISNEEAGRQRDAIADYREFLAVSQDVNSREEIEHKLRQWQGELREDLTSRDALPDDRQKTNPVPRQETTQGPDLYDVVAALGERSRRSIWFGSDVDCYGETAEKLYDLTKHNQPIEGDDFLHLTSGIRQTIAGDFYAFDPGASSQWLFIRAWNGDGFYVETNDPKSKERLKSQFPLVEEVDGAAAPYAGLFIRI